MFPPRRPMDPTRKDGLRRRSQSQPTPTPTLYNPAIYSYMCRGYYYASSDGKEGSEGICKGIKSKLEVLFDENQETISRQEALKRFTTLTADFDMSDDYEGDTNELHQQAKSVLIPPALIYKDTDAANKEPPNADEKPINPLLKETLPEEELIKRQEWSCYGSTEVEYLVLQDITTGEKKIAAVAPRNTGISFRDIETDDSLRSITRVGLGFLDIIHDSNSVIVEEDEDESTTVIGGLRQNMAEEVPPRPSIDALAIAKEHMERTFNFSKLVGAHMKMNLQWLGENLQDDFPARTYAAGQTIVAQIPKTVDQTFRSMGNIVSQLWNDDDYDED